MSIQIYPVAEQVKGGFNDGAIMENKPIQFTRDKLTLQPYSNIFYWAHAWANETSTIGLHPHQAFEIMSFVLQGEIAHYDTRNRKWITLKAGDVQIIRAGSGISHAEKLMKGSHIFQIWFDPDISSALRQVATYNDYEANTFLSEKREGLLIKLYKGGNAPVEMQSSDITIQQVTYKSGVFDLILDKHLIHSIYVLEGTLEVDKRIAGKNDFVVVEHQDVFHFNSRDAGSFFMISSPLHVPYKTYAENM